MICRLQLRHVAAFKLTGMSGSMAKMYFAAQKLGKWQVPRRQSPCRHFFGMLTSDHLFEIDSSLRNTAVERILFIESFTLGRSACG